MLTGILLGALGGIAAARIIRRARGGGGCGRRYRHGGGFGGHSLGGAGPGGFSFTGGRRWGRWAGRGLRWLSRELELNTRQEEEVKTIFDEVRQSVSDVRVSRPEMATLVDAFGDESFQRERLDEAASRHADAQSQVKKTVVDAIEHLHAILIPEQRQKLRELLARFGTRFGGRSSPDASPDAASL